MHMEKYTSMGGEAYVTQNITLAGGINVAQELPGWHPKVEKEQLLAWNPDVIMLVNGPLKEKSLTVDDVLADPMLQELNAVKNKRVYESGSYYIYWMHPTVAACLGVLQMSKAMYPERFEDISVTERANEFCTKFFGKSYPGDAGGVDKITTP